VTKLLPEFGHQTVDQLTLLYGNGQINLEPGFQRNSVWTVGDRRRLVQSIVAGYPVPSIFLYKRHEDGRLVYDVIDGKQRLESIFMFMKVGQFRRHGFDVRLDFGNGLEAFDWRSLSRRHADQAGAFLSYKIQTVEVTGELNQIIDLFVRINSTGKRLTTGERRHAQFFRSPFLKAANLLVGRSQAYLLAQRVLTKAQIERMKGTELVSELLMSIHQKGIINKKTSLDRAIGNDSVNGNTLQRLAREFTRTLNLVKRMFPELRQTRFHNTAEFYSLFMFVWEMDQAGFVLTHTKTNRVAMELLTKLSTEVDKLRERIRKAETSAKTAASLRDYLLTVQGDTDSSATRERRRVILKELLWRLYDRKDPQRGFSAEQRRIIWNTDEQKICAGCHKPLTWDDVTIDHIVAHSRGGRTSRNNAQLMHLSCNSSKGAR
jgi:hypothetical protein